MCGRFSLTKPVERLQPFFPLFDLADAPPRFNVAPTQDVLAVRQLEGNTRPKGTLLRWGLIPFWAEDKNIGARLINARAESVATKPAFRDAFRKRRCLVLADGFYEWKKSGGKKLPFHIRFPDGRPFAFAGLWDGWQGIESCTIITTDANAAVRPLHDRMPVILQPDDYGRWLDPAPKEPGMLEELLRPLPDSELTLVPVSERVNNVRNDDTGCLEEEKMLF